MQIAQDLRWCLLDSLHLCAEHGQWHRAILEEGIVKAAQIEAAGEGASAAAPIAWLRYEQDPETKRPSLRLRTWPGGEELLAWAHPHGRSVRWLSDH